MLAACGLGDGGPRAAWAGFVPDGDGKFRCSVLVIGMKSGSSAGAGRSGSPSKKREGPFPHTTPAAAFPRCRGSPRRGRRPNGPWNAPEPPFRPADGGGSIDYTLMRLEADPPPAALAAGPSGLEIRRAYEADAELLFPRCRRPTRWRKWCQPGDLQPRSGAPGFQRALRERWILYAVMGWAGGGQGGNQRVRIYLRSDRRSLRGPGLSGTRHRNQARRGTRRGTSGKGTEGGPLREKSATKPQSGLTGGRASPGEKNYRITYYTEVRR
jgi:hypothetical protein